MIILEDGVCGDVEMYCIMQRNVSVSQPLLMEIRWVTVTIETPVNVM